MVIWLATATVAAVIDPSCFMIRSLEISASGAMSI
jgi:hypothetical protein